MTATPERLTQSEVRQLEAEAHRHEEDAAESARRAQRIRRRLANAVAYTGGKPVEPESAP